MKNVTEVSVQKKISRHLVLGLMLYNSGSELETSNQPHASYLSDFEITHMVTP